MHVLKEIIRALVAFSIGAALGYLTLYSAQKSSTQFPTIDEIQDSQNISQDLSREEYKAVEKSRMSAVRVLSISEESGYLASSSGTYFTTKGKHYVLTVAHGLVGICEFTEIWADDQFYQCIEFVEFNVLIDYAIIEIEKIPSLRPLRIPQDLPTNQNWKKTYSAQSKIFYTGFPNNTGPLTFDGRVIGYHDDDYLYINSFAWGGASGSGIFNVKGKLIGYILAIDVGQTEFGVDVLENVIVIVPIFKIDWTTIL
tara:strand:- start:785 stop:1549 length:765 start_codon:yes stop_codon:yes gene_type:complete